LRIYEAGANIGSDGRVFGWGVTDVTNYSMFHMAGATTTLPSPVKHQQATSNNSAQNWTRTDVSLPFDADDLGTYLVSTGHTGYCYWCYCWILDTTSPAQTTLPWVTLTLRTSGATSPDNGARNQYIFLMGYDALGSFFSQGQGTNNIWRTAVEVVGTVWPSFFTGSITLQRQIVESRGYLGNGPNPYQILTNQPDTSDPGLRDDDPQSGYSGGKVYDLDAPGIGSAGGDPVGTVRRRRTNYLQWATLPNGTVVSSNFYWFSRHSIVKTGGGDQKQNDIPNDNVAGLGMTALTWNLQ